MIVCDRCGWTGHRSELLTFFSGLPSTGIRKELSCPNCGTKDWIDLEGDKGEMFEEYITENWICPVCGDAKKIQAEEIIKRSYKKNSLDVFEFVRISHSVLKVHCDECGSECYME